MPEVSPERMLKVQTELDASRAKCWAIQLKAEQDESTISTLRTALGLALPQADMLQVELHALLQKNKDLAAEKEALESAFNHVYLLKTVTDKESDELGHEKAALEGANMALQAYIAEYKREKESYIAEILDDALSSYEDYTLEDMEQGRHYEEFADECKRLNVNTSPIVTGASGAWNTNKRKRVSNQIQSLNLKIASYKKAKTSTPGNRDVEGNFLMDMHVKEVASKEKELSEASTAITELIKINRSLTAEIARMCTRHRHQLLDSAYRRQEDAIKAREVREKWHAFNRSKIHGLEAQITRGYQSSAHHITSLQSRISALEQNNKVLEQDKIHLQGQLLAQNSSPISSSPALRRK